MTDLAEYQVQRIVSLIAWMSQGDRETPVSFAAAARHLGVSEKTVRSDLEVLLRLTDELKSGLASMQVAITATGFILGSLGAFRRPLRLTGDEGLAVIIGLLQSRDGQQLARRLGALLEQAPRSAEVDRTWAFGPTPGEGVSRVLALARRARDERRKLDLLYCGSTAEPARRVVHPHQVVQDSGVWYIIAWCERARAVRHFRAERVLSAELLSEPFDPKPAIKPVQQRKDLLDAPAATTATVAFSPRIARWQRERYPDGQERPDGWYLIQLPVADPRWLARDLLQYGAEAEVLEPEGMREFIRTMVG